MKCSVIIPVYNDSTLHDCLTALAQLSGNMPEIIIVENGTKTDWIEPLVKKYQSNYQWRYYYRTEASAYAARNYGMQQATGDVFAFTDSDCSVAPNWLTEIQNVLANEQVDGVMGLAEGQGNSRVAEYEQRMYEANIHEFTSESKLRRIDTRNFAMKRRVYERIGDFASVRFGGDMEYGARTHAAGFLLTFSPAVRVYHHHLSSLADLMKKRVQQNSGNMELLKLHDTAFVQQYFPHLLRYRAGILSWLRWVVFSIAYWLLRPVSDIIVRFLPNSAGYIFFKAANVLAIRLGQLSSVIKKK